MVVTFPLPLHQGSRLAVEIFRTEKGIIFFDVGWCAGVGGGHPLHELEGVLKWVDDHWEITGGDFFEGPRIIEIYDPAKHPELKMNNDTWAEYLKTDEGGRLGSRERAKTFVR